jgi:hypothetical protein
VFFVHAGVNLMERDHLEDLDEDRKILPENNIKLDLKEIFWEDVD